MRTLIPIVFLIAFYGGFCQPPQAPPPATHPDSRRPGGDRPPPAGDEQRILKPYMQTDYIFHNKTGGQIRLVDVFTRPGDVYNILLNPDECAYVSHSLADPAYKSRLEIFFDNRSGKLLCGTAISDVNNQTADCSYKISEQERQNGFRRDSNSPVHYLEFYNVIDEDKMFETAHAPVSAGGSEEAFYKDKCKTWSSSKNIKFYCECLKDGLRIRDRRLVKGIEVHFFANAEDARQQDADRACKQKVTGYNQKGNASYLETPVPVSQVASEPLSKCTDESKVF